MANGIYGSAEENLKKLMEQLGQTTGTSTSQWGQNEIPTSNNGVALPGNSVVVGTTSTPNYGTPIIGGGATAGNNKINEVITDPYADAMKEYQAQINALATETDPDYDENLEQASPEEMAEEIL